MDVHPRPAQRVTAFNATEAVSSPQSHSGAVAGCTIRPSADAIAKRSFMSLSDSSKSNSCRFSARRAGCADFGPVTMPGCWIFHRKRICAGVFPTRRAIVTIVGSSARRPCPKQTLCHSPGMPRGASSGPGADDIRTGWPSTSHHDQLRAQLPPLAA